MANDTDQAIEKFMERGQAMLESNLRTKSVRYDVKSDRVIVDLINDCAFALPPRQFQGLQDIAIDDLVGVSILGSGFLISWDRPDVQISIAGLINSISGAKKYMQAELAREAGSVTSPARASAARNNGTKGGRSRNVA